jgi:hypothetical protein
VLWCVGAGRVLFKLEPLVAWSMLVCVCEACTATVTMGLCARMPEESAFLTGVPPVTTLRRASNSGGPGPNMNRFRGRIFFVCWSECCPASGACGFEAAVAEAFPRPTYLTPCGPCRHSSAQVSMRGHWALASTNLHSQLEVCPLRRLRQRPPTSSPHRERCTRVAFQKKTPDCVEGCDRQRRRNWAKLLT